MAAPRPPPPSPRAGGALPLAAVEFDENMGRKEALAWLARQLNRAPEAADLYAAGKELLQRGLHRGAATLLAEYASRPGCEPPGRHLLGYAAFYAGQLALAREQLAQSVGAGFEADWQLLVEVCVELETQGARAAANAAAQ
jgi:hypothetical protein